MSAVAELVPAIPARRALRALGGAPATWYRRRALRLPGALRRRPVPPLALSVLERQRIVATLTSPRFADVTPYTAWARLLDEDATYLASVRTFYRVLAAEGLVQERRNQLVHPAHIKPELLATGPNQVWNWDITRLRSTIKWQFFYLYVLLDIFSRLYAFFRGFHLADDDGLWTLWAEGRAVGNALAFSTASAPVRRRGLPANCPQVQQPLVGNARGCGADRWCVRLPSETVKEPGWRGI